MGVREYLPIIGKGASTVYYECVKCGKTLDVNRTCCPSCNGRVAVYEF